MKAAVLGAGGLGRVIALELALDRRVTDLVLVDKRGDRSRALKSLGKTSNITTLQADVTDHDALRRILDGVDVAVNATLPRNNLRIMDVCRDAGCGYVDSAGFTPTTPEEGGGVLEQLGLDASWRSRDLTAVVCMGSDPGISNIMARVASEPLASIESIRVRKAASGQHAAAGFPLYSREIFLRDALARPLVWEGTRFVDHDPVSGTEDFAFPDPVGVRKVHLFPHEEVLTLPARLGKPVGWVDYKHDINPDLVWAILELNALGLLDPDRRVRIGNTVLSFRDAFLAAFPEPSTLIGPLAGSLAIVVEVRGTRADGSRTAFRASLVMAHRDANKRRGTTAERSLTAAAAVAGMVLLHEKRLPRTGVLTPEELPPAVVVAELEGRGVRFEVKEIPA